MVKADVVGRREEGGRHSIRRVGERVMRRSADQLVKASIFIALKAGEARDQGLQEAINKL